ncbi:hypothetical protein AB0442_37715 [Kitasatospora sp. NPDC085895]|uniref:hypothetical protein n=1 Tax=Kitasatospora sp. NPDC085895 TaxID=3155057 RepID=UPI00344F3CB0
MDTCRACPISGDGRAVLEEATSDAHGDPVKIRSFFQDRTAAKNRADSCRTGRAPHAQPGATTTTTQKSATLHNKKPGRTGVPDIHLVDWWIP